MKDSELAQAVMIAVVLTVVFALTYSTFGHTLLLRPFWMDEVHSWLLISDPDPLHALSALKNGADYNPPVYYAVARLFSSVVPFNEHNLRVLSVLLTLSTAIGLALVLDRFMRMPASIGCSLLICSQQLVILQSTEARFYALWLALLTWFCFGLTTGKRQFIGIQLAVLSLLAAMTAGTHYFGIVSIGIVCTAFVVVRRFHKDALIRAGVPFAVGVATVASCLPLISSQKTALTVPTWVTPANLERTTNYLVQFFPNMLLLVSFAIWLIGFFLRPAKRANSIPTASKTEALEVATAKDHDDDLKAVSDENDKVPPDALFVFGSLILMPVVLIVFSIVVQPAMVNRYAIAGCLWLLPVLTCLLKGSGRPKSLLVFTAGCVMFSLAVRHGSATWDYNLKDSRELATQLKLVPEDEIVLFEDRIEYWMLQHRNPHPTWYQLDFDTQEIPDASNLQLVQRDVARAIQPLYPNRFPLKSISELNGRNFYLVPQKSDQPDAVGIGDGRQLKQISGRIYKASAQLAPEV